MKTQTFATVATQCHTWQRWPAGPGNGFGVALGLAVLASGLICSWAQSSEYSFQQASVTGDNFTQLLGINNNHRIVGYHNSTNFQGFSLALPSNFTKENFPGAAQTQVVGINSRGDTAGFYIDAGGTNHGFLNIKGTFQTVDFADTVLNQLLGINDFGQAAGYYADANNNDHTYVFDSKGGVFMVLTIPGAVSAQATGINNSQSISGFYIDTKGTNHAFVLISGALKTIDFPEAIFAQALGLNNQGQVVGVYMDLAGMSHGFVYWNGYFQSIDEPNGVGTTTVNGINDRGQLVGFYVDSAGNTDGFVATPNRRIRDFDEDD
jgi:hypothetical protein